MIVNSHENVIEVEGLTNFHPQHFLNVVKPSLELGWKRIYRGGCR